MTLRYHRLYQISSLEANLSLEDMKYLALKTEATLCIHTPKLTTKSDLFQQS